MSKDSLLRSLLIENSLVENHSPTDEEKTLLSRAAKVGAETFTDADKAKYQRAYKSTNTPLALTHEEIQEMALLKISASVREMDRKIRVIKNIAIFFCVLGVIGLVGMIIGVASLLGG